MGARTYFNPETCTRLGEFIEGRECRLEGTLYGYRPNLGVNVFFAAVFAICLVVNLGLGIRHRTWTYLIATVAGCLLELVGYIGRIMMNNNPFSDIGFQLQISLLIIAPAFLSAGVYLTLKHIIINLGEKWSRLRPAWYTYIFITGDIISLCLQGAGGGLAATASNGSSLLDVGTNLMITGVVFQVVMLSVFLLAVAEYALRSYRHRDELSHEAMELLNTKKFRIFCWAIGTAFLTIFIRCIYRIPELTGGWGSALMRNEPEFIVLEGIMIVVAGVALTVCHPGIFFPQMTPAGQKAYRPSKSVEEGGSGTEMLPRA